MEVSAQQMSDVVNQSSDDEFIIRTRLDRNTGTKLLVNKLLVNMTR